MKNILRLSCRCAENSDQHEVKNSHFNSGNHSHLCFCFFYILFLTYTLVIWFCHWLVCFYWFAIIWVGLALVGLLKPLIFEAGLDKLRAIIQGNLGFIFATPLGPQAGFIVGVGFLWENQVFSSAVQRLMKGTYKMLQALMGQHTKLGCEIPVFCWD